MCDKPSSVEEGADRVARGCFPAALRHEPSLDELFDRSPGCLSIEPFLRGRRRFHLERSGDRPLQLSDARRAGDRRPEAECFGLQPASVDRDRKRGLCDRD